MNKDHIRFQKYVDKNGPLPDQSKSYYQGLDECWSWLGYRKLLASGLDYGRIQVGKKQWLAHRYAWLMAFGEIPEGIMVLHKCDNKGCVNPNHLFLGTSDDNMKDMKRKEQGPCSPETKKRLSEISVARGATPPNMKGIPFTQEHKDKIGKRFKGSTFYNNGVVNKRIFVGEKPPKGFVVGRIT